ncbi:DUF4097 family beta strand repeat-containing protein [Streptacidiphilus sp. MAP5-3]|uniref:DUF4097 family beta strand repeat-containing protein n=1 Tax=unclassified Streptacidiphilus TaxID=2643834 RepID=UPI003512FC5E
MVIVVVAVIAATGVVGWLTAQHSSESRAYRDARINVVEVNATSASVTIHPGPAGQATVTQKLRWSTARPAVDQRLDTATGTLTITALCGGIQVFGLSDCEARVDIQVPVGASVQVFNDSGATDVFAMGAAVDVRSDSGAVTLSRLTGPVQASTTSGSISGDAMLSPTVSAAATAGSIDLAFAGPPRSVTVKATAGSVDVTVPRGDRYRVSVMSNDNSAVSVDDGLASPTAQNSITGSTVAGALSINYG